MIYDENPIMDEIVENICDSLINESHDWILGNYTFYNIKKPTIEYWKFARKSITETYNEVTKLHEVFSYKQGTKIYDAYLKAKVNQANAEQERIISILKPKDPISPVPLPPKTKVQSKPRWFEWF